MKIVVSLGLALLAHPAVGQSLVIEGLGGGGRVFGPTSRQSGPIVGSHILTPDGMSTIHHDKMGGGIVIDEHGGVHIMTPDYGTGTHMIH